MALAAIAAAAIVLLKIATRPSKLVFFPYGGGLFVGEPFTPLPIPPLPRDYPRKVLPCPTAKYIGVVVHSSRELFEFLARVA
jgi:hypothetical protein